MWRAASSGLGLIAGGMLMLATPAQAQTLGAAETFAVLGGSTVTNTGPTLLIGDLGVSPGLAIVGFPPGSVTGTIYLGAASLAGTAHADTITAYNSIVAMSVGTNLTGQDLGGMTLTPGTYTFNTSAQLTGALILDPLGDSNAAFHFRIGSTLTTADFSSVSVLGGVQLANIFWQVGSSATLGFATAFTGNILALTSITLTTGASISDGRALAINGAVTMDSNNIDNGGLAGAMIGITGTYWKGGFNNLWSEMNWSPDFPGAVDQNIPAAGAHVIFSVTGVAPANQDTRLDMNQSIDSLTINDSAAVSISGPNTLLYPTVTYDASNAYITWVQDSLTSVPGLTPNQVATGGGLDGFQFLNPGDPLVTYLDGQPLSELPGLYDLIAPDELTAIFQIGFHAAEIQASSLQQHLQRVRMGVRQSSASPPVDTISSSGKGSVGGGAKGVTSSYIATDIYERRWNFFIEGLGGTANVGSTSNASGYDFNTYGTALLADATGSTDGLEFNSLINGGYDHQVGDLTMGVFSSFAYTRVNLDGFSETGSLAPLNYPGQHQESLRSNLGVRVSYTTQLGRMWLTPQARASWQHEFLDSMQSIDSSFASGPGSGVRRQRSQYRPRQSASQCRPAPAGHSRRRHLYLLRRPDRTHELRLAQCDAGRERQLLARISHTLLLRLDIAMREIRPAR